MSQKFWFLVKFVDLIGSSLLISYKFYLSIILCFLLPGAISLCINSQKCKFDSIFFFVEFDLKIFLLLPF